MFWFFQTNVLISLYIKLFKKIGIFSEQATMLAEIDFAIIPGLLVQSIKPCQVLVVKSRHSYTDLRLFISSLCYSHLTITFPHKLTFASSYSYTNISDSIISFLAFSIIFNPYTHKKFRLYRICIIDLLYCEFNLSPDVHEIEKSEKWREWINDWKLMVVNTSDEKNRWIWRENKRRRRKLSKIGKFSK